MAQVFFAGTTTPQASDLDANFSALWSLYSMTSPGTGMLGFYSAPTMAYAGDGWRVVQLQGATWASNGPNNQIFGLNMSGGMLAPTYASANPACYHQQVIGQFIWFTAPTGTVGASIPFTQTATMTAVNFNYGTINSDASGASNATTGIQMSASGTIATKAISGTINFIANRSDSVAGQLGASFRMGGVEKGNITINSSSVTYNTSSDYRLKSSIQPISPAASGAFIDALKPSTWSWNLDGSAGAGFIAHELQAVSPSSVTGDKDASQAVGTLKDANGAVMQTSVPAPPMLEDGETWEPTGTAPVYQSVEYGSAEVIAMMVAELKSLRARVAALEGAH